MTISIEEIHREILRDPESAAGYLGAALERRDEAGVLLAVKDLAEAQDGGIPALAKRLGMSHSALLEHLSSERGIDWGDFRKIVRGLGLRLTVDLQADAAAASAEETEEAEAPVATISASQPPATAAAMQAERPGA